ncbi:glutathione S-transferase omega-1-like isoform 1-T1 [Cyanocitta cristata]
MKQNSCRREKSFSLPSRWGWIGFWRVVDDAGGSTEGNLVPHQLLEALLINTPGPWGGAQPWVSYSHGSARGGCAVLCKRREGEHREQLHSACRSWVGRAVSSRTDLRTSSPAQQRAAALPRPERVGREAGRGGAVPAERQSPPIAATHRSHGSEPIAWCRHVGRSLPQPGQGHEVININLKNKPEWYFEKNPAGLVPVLETSKGQLICESPITCEYLDEAFPGKKLMPSDPYERACQRMLLEDFSKITSLLFKHVLAVKDGQDTTALKAEIAEKFGRLEEVLSKRNTVFYGGDSVSMVDYMIWPWFERLEAFQLKDSLNHAPKLQRWVEAMKEDPAVKATITDPQTFKNYLQLYLKNSPEACDYGL